MGTLLTVAPLLGLIAMVMSLSHLLPLSISVSVGDGATSQFLFSMVANSAVGYLMWITTRRYRRDLKPRDAIASK